MTTTNNSRFKGFIRTPVAEFSKELPLSTHIVRDGIFNNLESIYNGHFQVRINSTINKTYSWGGDDLNSRFLIQTFGPFPVSRLKNGKLAPLFVTANIGKGNSTSFKLQFVLRSATTGNVHAADTLNVTSTTMGWLKLFSDSNSLLQAGNVPLNDHIQSEFSATDKTYIASPTSMMVLDMFFDGSGAEDFEANFGSLFVVELPFEP